MIPAQSTPHSVRFGLYEADFKAGELLFRGRNQRLQEKPLRLLRVLLANAGELISREELRHELWPPDTVLDFERGLNTAMNKLRIALRDPASNPRFIETLHGRGYRFVAPISASRQSELSASEIERTRAEHLFERREPGALRAALRSFQHLIDLEPASAAGYAGSALCWCLLGDYGWLAPVDAFPRSEAAARRALQLDPLDARARAALGFILHRWKRDRHEAEAEYRQAIDYDGLWATSHQWYAEFLSQHGRHGEAIARIATARRRDPLSPTIAIVEPWILYHAGRYEAAAELALRARDLREDFLLGDYLLGRIRLAQGETDAALELANRCYERRATPPDTQQPASSFVLGLRALVAISMDNFVRAEHCLSELGNYDDSAYFRAKILVHLGRPDEATACLWEGLSTRSTWLLDLGVDPEFANWRELAESENLLAELGLN